MKLSYHTWFDLTDKFGKALGSSKLKRKLFVLSVARLLNTRCALFDTLFIIFNRKLSFQSFTEV